MDTECIEKRILTLADVGTVGCFAENQNVRINGQHSGIFYQVYVSQT